MIDRETWIEIIKDFQELELPDLIEREKKIDVDIPIKRAISIIGPRRNLLRRFSKVNFLEVDMYFSSLKSLANKNSLKLNGYISSDIVLPRIDVDISLDKSFDEDPDTNI